MDQKGFELRKRLVLQHFQESIAGIVRILAECEPLPDKPVVISVRGNLSTQLVRSEVARILDKHFPLKPSTQTKEMKMATTKKATSKKAPKKPESIKSMAKDLKAKAVKKGVKIAKKKVGDLIDKAANSI